MRLTQIRYHFKGPLVLQAVLFLWVFSCGSLTEAALIKTLSGTVAKVDLDNRRVHVDFRHPATGEMQEKIFQIRDRTGIGGVPSLADFSIRDAISIDYEENEEGLLVAHYIKKVQLTGPPPGLENFRGF